jgi:hypothetical protein
MAKFSIASAQTAHRSAGEEAIREGGSVKEERRRENRPNAVTPITLRLRRELCLCQVTIISYTSWPFLKVRLAPVR